MKRHHLGSWTFPSGNSVDVAIVGEGRLRTLALGWDHPPPLRAVDELHYRLVVRPEILRAAREYLELIGSSLVVELA